MSIFAFMSHLDWAKAIAICAISLLSDTCAAQPDSLHYQMDGRTYSSKILYPDAPTTSKHKLVGKYAFDTSRVAVTIPYRNGKPSGLYMAYYPDGSKLIQAVYGWGSLHGDWTEYDEEGVITLKGQYRDGKRHGMWVYRKDGIRGHYKKGLKHGKWKYYDGRTIQRIEKYHKGKLVQGGTFRFKNR